MEFITSYGLTKSMSSR